jgi:hypothetical protein
MQNYCKTIGALAAASALVAGNASAEIEYELHTGYTNQYIFRGTDLGDNLTEVGLDAATEINGFGLSAGAWYASFEESTFDSGPYRSANADELDLYAEVNRDLGFATLGVGYIYYYYPQGKANSALLGRYSSDAEVYFTASRDFGFVDASFTYYWCVKGELGGYSELALSRSFPINPCLAVSVNTNVSYIFDDAKFGAWNTKVALDWGFAEHATLSPFVALSVGLTDYNRYASDNDNELVGGSMLSVSF